MKKVKMYLIIILVILVILVLGYFIFTASEVGI